MQIILQPIANDVAFSNYNKTIIQSTDLATIKPFLSDTELDLLKKHKEHNEVRIWGESSKGNDYEYIYFLNNLTDQNINIKDFNRSVGYSPNNIVQGFSVLPEDRSMNAIRDFNLLNTYSNFNSRQKIWIEKTLVRDRYDREHGERALGNAVWSPTTSTSGGDIYKNMRKIKKGDAIIHLVDNIHFSGVSIVNNDIYEEVKGLPNTNWDETRDCYLHRLKDYTLLDKPITKEEVFTLKNKNHLVNIMNKSEVFYTSNHQLRQGAYLTPCINELAKLLNDIYFTKTTKNLPHINFSPQKDSGNEPEVKKEDKHMEEPLNLILYGPPGTGKTFKFNTDWKIRFNDRIDFVTFHQSYSYEDFIEGIKPVLRNESEIENNSDSSIFANEMKNNNELQYQIESGIFKNLCKKAEKDPENEYAIFIDEINRGNVANIFGELITLIEKDKRIGAPNELKTVLPYSKEEFGIPSNVYIIGTMNTADRSIEALDTALRRRFSFLEVLPNYSVINKNINGIKLNQLLETINLRIEKLLDRDHIIGHSYLLNINNLEELKVVFRDQLVPLLKEYFFGDYGKIGLILGGSFIKEIKYEISLASNLDYDVNIYDDKTVFRFVNISELSAEHFIEIYQNA